MDSSARLSHLKLKYSTSFNLQNLNSAKLELKKTWKIPIPLAKTRNTGVKVELDACSNSTVWNLMKLKFNKKWARSGTTEFIYYSKLATLHMVWHLKLEVIENYCNSNREWKVIFCVIVHVFIDTPFWFHKYFNVLVDQLSQFYSSKRHFVEILFFFRLLNDHF